jgi:hypothetical protein
MKAELIETKIFCDKDLRKRWWPEPLAKEWLLQYPGLFDFDDFRQATRQPEKHFFEWFAAIHLFQRDGSMSLVEKCAYPSNPVKYERYLSLIDEETRVELDAIRRRCRGVQLPDLMVIASDHKKISFAEVKGDRDKLRPGQPELLEEIVALGIDVELIEVVPRNVLLERDAWRQRSGTKKQA